MGLISRLKTKLLTGRWPISINSPYKFQVLSFPSDADWNSLKYFHQDFQTIPEIKFYQIIDALLHECLTYTNKKKKKASELIQDPKFLDYSFIYDDDDDHCFEVLYLDSRQQVIFWKNVEGIMGNHIPDPFEAEPPINCLRSLFFFIANNIGK